MLNSAILVGGLFSIDHEEGYDKIDKFFEEKKHYVINHSSRTQDDGETQSNKSSIIKMSDVFELTCHMLTSSPMRKHFFQR